MCACYSVSLLTCISGSEAWDYKNGSTYLGITMFLEQTVL